MKTMRDDADDGFTGYLLGRGLQQTTAATYRRSVRGLQAWLRAEGLLVDELSYRDLLAWLATLSGSARTRSQHLTAVRHYLAWQVETGRLLRNTKRTLT